MLTSDFKTIDAVQHPPDPNVTYFITNNILINLYPLYITKCCTNKNNLHYYHFYRQTFRQQTTPCDSDIKLHLFKFYISILIA